MPKLIGYFRVLCYNSAKIKINKAVNEKTLISFDYAIKYLLKNKGDYDIVEGFISALIGSAGYKPVKIKASRHCQER